jgi:hypothetical protein
VNSSPKRNSFGEETYIKRQQEQGNELSDEYLEMFANIRKNKKLQEADPEWQRDNLEYDLRSTEWICNKAKASEVYAQNLYAALCNNQFQRRDVMPILKNETWSCSWRYAGGIIADMRESGDYIDWYCSGIMDTDVFPAGFVPESCATMEIIADLRALGWNVILDEDGAV